MHTETVYPNGVTEKAVYDPSRRVSCLYSYTGTPPAVGTDDCPTASTSLLTFFAYTYLSPAGRDTAGAGPRPTGTDTPPATPTTASTGSSAPAP